MFKCTYQCFSVHTIMRQSSETTAVPNRVLSSLYSRLTDALEGPIMFAAYSSISLDPRKHIPTKVYEVCDEVF